MQVHITSFGSFYSGAHFGGVLVGYLMGNMFFSIEHSKQLVRRAVPIVSGLLVAIFFGVGLGCFYGGAVNVSEM